MATLEKRVQVLLSVEQFARLEAAAKVERVSVGAFIRDAVDQRMRNSRVEALEALERLFERADAHPVPAPTPEEWDRMKDEMWEREPLRDSGEPLRDSE